MKNKTKILMSLAVAGLLSTGYVFAQGEDHGQVIDEKQAAADVAAKKAVEVGNKICPVSGNPIPAPGKKGEMGEAVKYEYNGKIYNLCCSMCIKDFKNNPEKYSKIAEDEVKNQPLK